MLCLFTSLIGGGGGGGVQFQYFCRVSESDHFCYFLFFFWRGGSKLDFVCGGAGGGVGRRFLNQLLMRVFCDEVNGHNYQRQCAYMCIRNSSRGYVSNAYFLGKTRILYPIFFGEGRGGVSVKMDVYGVHIRC